MAEIGCLLATSGSQATKSDQPRCYGGQSTKKKKTSRRPKQRQPSLLRQCSQRARQKPRSEAGRKVRGSRSRSPEACGMFELTEPRDRSSDLLIDDSGEAMRGPVLGNYCRMLELGRQ